MEEVPVTKKIGLIYIIIGISYFLILTAIAIIFPVSGSSHSGDAAMMIVILGLVSIPIIISGLLIIKKKRTPLVVVSALLLLYAGWWFLGLLSLILDDGGVIGIVYFISFSLVPGFLAILNLILVDKQFKVFGEEPSNGEV